MTEALALAETRNLSGRASNALHWRLLRLLNLFRIGVAGLLLTLDFTGRIPELFGSHAPRLFLWTIIVYLVFGLLSGATLSKRQLPLTLQSHIQLAADVAAIVLLTYASGGMASGLGSLLFVTVATGSFVLHSRLAILLAAVASLGMLGVQFLGILEGYASETGYTQAALLGAIFFATALAGSRLASRVRESEALAIRRGVDLQNVSQLNDYIIQHLQTGIVVLDEDGTLRQLNAAAAQYLGISIRSRGRSASEASPRLVAMLESWIKDRSEQPPSFKAADGRSVIIPRITRVGSRTRGGLLVFLEDAQLAAEKVQQMKLAALGRLTASIAHEIRNPLSAVSHANQLLGESERLGSEEQRLVKIIDDQTSRVNIIIENVLQLSRRDATRPERLDLEDWLNEFAVEFTVNRALPQGTLRVILPEGPVAALVDPRHLHQIIWNLVENAIRHAGAGINGSSVELRAGQHPVSQQTYLEIEDQGTGIDPEIADNIFEPFYTNNPKGTGLGLFIARELCEVNRATLTYSPGPEGGSCFRVTFADPERWVT